MAVHVTRKRNVVTGAIAHPGMIQKKKILLLGEYGAFSRRIYRALSRSPHIECVIGVADARHARSQRGADCALVTVLGDPHSIQGAIKDVFAVVNTRGPFLDRNYTVAEQCAERGVHYVDPADSNERGRGAGGLRVAGGYAGAGIRPHSRNSRLPGPGEKRLSRPRDRARDPEVFRSCLAHEGEGPMARA